MFFGSGYSINYLSGSSVGATMNNLNHRILNNLPIPLPPLPEQHRIVSKINALLSLCDNLEQNLKNASDKQTEIFNSVLAKV
jgi:type I restriction enzyme S subunit